MVLLAWTTQLVQCSNMRDGLLQELATFGAVRSHFSFTDWYLVSRSSHNSKFLLLHLWIAREVSPLAL